MRIETLPSPGTHSRAISLRTLCAAVISTFEVAAKGYPSKQHPKAAQLGAFFAACARSAYAVSTTPPPVNTVLPVITGTAQVGQTLTGTLGTFTGATATARQWYAAGTAIAGATAGTYVVVAGDVGKKITLKVTATNAYGYTVATSLPTATVIA